jgi:hypothetical protein
VSSFLVFLLIAAVPVLASSCTQPAAQDVAGKAPGEHGRVPSAAPSAREHAKALSSVVPSFAEALPDGCYNGAAVVGLAPQAAVLRIAERCAPSMQPLLQAPIIAKAEHGAPATFHFSIEDPSRCVKIIAATTAASELALSLYFADTELAKDSMRAPFSLLAADGPLCLDRGGEHRVVAAVDEPTTAALQVYVAERPQRKK